MGEEITEKTEREIWKRRLRKEKKEMRMILRD